MGRTLSESLVLLQRQPPLTAGGNCFRRDFAMTPLRLTAAELAVKSSRVICQINQRVRHLGPILKEEGGEKVLSRGVPSRKGGKAGTKDGEADGEAERSPKETEPKTLVKSVPKELRKKLKQSVPEESAQEKPLKPQTHVIDDYILLLDRLIAASALTPLGPSKPEDAAGRHLNWAVAQKLRDFLLFQQELLSQELQLEAETVKSLLGLRFNRLVSDCKNVEYCQEYAIRQLELELLQLEKAGQARRT